MALPKDNQPKKRDFYTLEFVAKITESPKQINEENQPTSKPPIYGSR
jgi:hypothetical protein